MKLLTIEEKENLKKVCAEKYLENNKVNRKEISEKTGISIPVVDYYCRKWGYTKKQKRTKKVKNVDHISLAQAIAICKKAGLKVIREVTKTEEL